MSRAREIAAPAHPKRGPRRLWQWIVRSYEERLGQRIPPVDALQDVIDKRVATGEDEEDATRDVIEDFERSAATINTRATPLVPASGIVVAGAGILSKEGDAAAAFAFVAMAFALGGLGLLAAALFTHAGRRTVGLTPTRDDVAFARARLIKKESKAQKGSLLTFLGFVVVLVVIL